ncbi:MAG: hypothetical protein M1570_03090 [Chloroflexi bacterium]|nr:hypothetical protein [Chloroflexota bacterium]
MQEEKRKPALAARASGGVDCDFSIPSLDNDYTTLPDLRQAPEVPNIQDVAILSNAGWTLEQVVDTLGRKDSVLFLDPRIARQWLSPIYQNCQVIDLSLETREREILDDLFKLIKDFTMPENSGTLKAVLVAHVLSARACGHLIYQASERHLAKLVGVSRGTAHARNSDLIEIGLVARLQRGTTAEGASFTLSIKGILDYASHVCTDDPSKLPPPKAVALNHCAWKARAYFSR